MLFYRLLSIVMLVFLISCEVETETPIATKMPTKGLSEERNPVDLLIFKKEQKVELWEKVAKNELVFIEKRSLKAGFDLPIGHFESKSGKMELLFPKKISADHSHVYSARSYPDFDHPGEGILIQDWVENGQTLSKYPLDQVLIFPNDGRKSGQLTPCLACPHWMAEIYGKLELKLQQYSIDQSPE